MLLPLAPHFGYSRVAPALQRIEFIVGHLGERPDPLLKEYFGLASSSLCGLVKVGSQFPLVGSPSIVEFSRESLALRAVYLPRLRHRQV
jgi:hypothetical protein